MDIGNQIRTRRQKLGLSQDELASKVYVSRQTISNWETDKTYPDIQSLLLLSALFDTSIDELVKGDVEEMENTIATADAKKMLRLGWIMFGLLVLMVPFGAVGHMLWEGWGLLLSLAPWVGAMAAALAVERIKDSNDVQTYREIVAFTKGEPIDRSNRPVWALARAGKYGSGKKSFALRMLMGIAFVAGGALIGYALGYLGDLVGIF